MRTLLFVSTLLMSCLANAVGADTLETQIPVCSAPAANTGQATQGAATHAAPWSETRPDLAQLELLACLARQEAAYRARGDQTHAAAVRSRMRAVRQTACQNFDQQNLPCPVPSHPAQFSSHSTQAPSQRAHSPAHRTDFPAAGCRIEGPSQLLPESVPRIRIGMSKADLESILGAPDYSPAEGLYYFSMGGDCPVGETTRLVSCGVVAEFRGAYSDETGEQGEQGEQDKLQSCWWGAIAE